MSIINNPEFLRQVIYFIANRAYETEISECGMEGVTVGPGLDYEDKKDWMQSWMEEVFDEVKEKVVAFKSADDEDKFSASTDLCRKFYNLDFAESMEISPSIIVMRVPGGFLYCSTNPNVSAQTFVPFDNEFDPVE